MQQIKKMGLLKPISQEVRLKDPSRQPGRYLKSNLRGLFVTRSKNYFVFVFFDSD